MTEMPPFWIYLAGIVLAVAVTAGALVLRDAGHFDAVPILLGFFATHFFIDIIKSVVLR